jgi:hypothetical protein
MNGGISSSLSSSNLLPCEGLQFFIDLFLHDTHLEEGRMSLFSDASPLAEWRSQVVGDSWFSASIVPSNSLRGLVWW